MLKCHFTWHLNIYEHDKELRALRGKFDPLLSQKLKVGFHHFHPIGLLEEWSKCKVLAFILLLPLLWLLTKIADKIEKLPFWAKFKAF